MLLFCTVLAGVPFSPARAALVPDVLPSEKFLVGSAIGNITFQASQILGFLAGAAAVAILDPHKTLAIDSVTFGLSALTSVPACEAAPRRPATGRSGPPCCLPRPTVSGSSSAAACCWPCCSSADSRASTSCPRA